ncbi:MAG: 1-(5-phosphoribosyl)-5-((5-phosphoribosylamino)methylideneamino) imidazole-4-carboxamide isomerase [candidate division TA06 bacterium ADurb.Bin131]|uniref:1-(5-phosphoribosyl)-5-[(5-phosphoribosylamino)methylideneamino] imidazole-4-carboxamide isomerase n=1 Tax=candidate division TA06 bacterium ADurb.Bin131 TaxID=1852827 RepID=A0A1V6C460_UNCT6|nr:MAG: 1-(5-phosphoribosyl)-5-((5-phosphoribosylamino)methylideneamino) imidazole-4-carboxamide isomerase [candidate division TA06 bacterium ADurb.Bin131]HQL64482.1 HisA/HisF-related TIM barrel protein [bacterium]
MIIIPAIDLKKSKVVRLHKGRFENVTSYGLNPEDIVRNFILKGAKRIHIVSLLGAKDGKILEEDTSTIKSMVKIRDIMAFEKCEIQVGGGLRKIEQIKTFLGMGIDYLIVGTAIVLPQLLELNFSLSDIAKVYNLADKKFDIEKEMPEPNIIDKMDLNMKKRIIVSIDISRDSVALSGWLVTIPVEPSYVIKKLVEKGFFRFMITDTTRDGTMDGINIEAFSQIINKSNELTEQDLEFIIGGGVASEKDIEDIVESKLPVSGVVIGKALYEQKVQLHTLIKRFQKP